MIFAFNLLFFVGVLSNSNPDLNLLRGSWMKQPPAVESSTMISMIRKSKSVLYDMLYRYILYIIIYMFYIYIRYNIYICNEISLLFPSGENVRRWAAHVYERSATLQEARPVDIPKWRTRKWRLNSTDLYWLVGWANRSVGCTPPLLGGSSNRKWWTELWLVNPRFVDYPIYNWLVVEPPLWKIWVSWGYYSQLNGKIIQMFQSTNQLQIYTVSTQEWIEKLETWKMWGTYHRYIFELPSW